MEEDKDSSRGFRVTDRRRFTEDSEAQEGTHASEEAEAAAPEPEPASPASSGPDPGPAIGTSPDEPVSFSTFILGLSTQALLHLGDIESPVSGQVERDLGAARHVIDILGILQAKTRNNLEQAEERLLEAVLYDLRMRYVELVRGTSKEEA
jgi:Domain of unknown function (DUF1844)